MPKFYKEENKTVYDGEGEIIFSLNPYGFNIDKDIEDTVIKNFYVYGVKNSLKERLKALWILWKHTSKGVK